VSSQVCHKVWGILDWDMSGATICRVCIYVVHKMRGYTSGEELSTTIGSYSQIRGSYPQADRGVES